MFLINRLHSLRALFVSLCLVFLLSPVFAFSEEIEDSTSLFNGFQESSSTSSRAPKPLSQTAENVTVITSKEI